MFGFDLLNANAQWDMYVEFSDFNNHGFPIPFQFNVRCAIANCPRV